MRGAKYFLLTLMPACSLQFGGSLPISDGVLDAVFSERAFLVTGSHYQCVKPQQFDTGQFCLIYFVPDKPEQLTGLSVELFMGNMYAGTNSSKIGPDYYSSQPTAPTQRLSLRPGDTLYMYLTGQSSIRQFRFLFRDR